MELTGQMVLNPMKTGFNSPETLDEPVVESAIDNEIYNRRKAFESTFDNLFHTDKEESQVQKARAILGDSVANVPDEELLVYLTEFQYLLDEWLDIYEKQLFKGKTLQQLEREG